MSTDKTIDHELLKSHLEKVELKANDFVILGVRPTKNDGWYQVAVAQHIVRDNDQATTVVKDNRIDFRRGKGDDAWGSNKARWHWDSLTLQDIEEKYKDYPAVLTAAKKCREKGNYVLVADEDGNPIMNPMYKHNDNEYPYVLDVWEDHQIESEWDAVNLSSSAKQDGNGNYLFKNYGGDLVNGKWAGGKNFAIFTHYAVNVGVPVRDLMAHSGSTTDVRALKIQTPDTLGASTLPGIADSAEDKQKSQQDLTGTKEPDMATN